MIDIIELEFNIPMEEIKEPVSLDHIRDNVISLITDKSRVTRYKEAAKVLAQHSALSYSIVDLESTFDGLKPKEGQVAYGIDTNQPLEIIGYCTTIPFFMVSDAGYNARKEALKAGKTAEETETMVSTAMQEAAKIQGERYPISLPKQVSQ